MAKSKASRKGKKEWRKNISAEEQENFLQKLSKEEQTGGSLDNLTNENLYFVDKSKDEKTVRKIDRFRNKILHVDSVLQRNSLIPPIGLNLLKKKKKPMLNKANKSVSKLSNKTTQLTSAKNGKKTSTLTDIWDENAKNEDEDFSNLTFDEQLPKENSQRIIKKLNSEKHHIPPPPVEIDMPGCSFNPSFQSHQDALAMAVAHEMKKELKKELEPPPFPKFFFQKMKDGDLMEEDENNDRLLLESTLGLSNGGKEGEGEGEGEEGEEKNTLSFSKPTKEKRLTRSDKNRRMRRKVQERELAVRREEKKRRRDVDKMKEFLSEIKEKEEENEMKRLRKEAFEEEKKRELPPNLGSHIFEPEPLQVLLTEDVTGSLRQLKGCSTLSRDRFKSFQRRGIIEPRKLVKKKASSKKYRIVEVGSRGKKEIQMKAEIEMLRAERKEMEMVAKAKRMESMEQN